VYRGITRGVAPLPGFAVQGPGMRQFAQVEVTARKADALPAAIANYLYRRNQRPSAVPAGVCLRQTEVCHANNVLQVVAVRTIARIVAVVYAVTTDISNDL